MNMVIGGLVMDIAKIPIVDFLKYCKEGAKRKGYSWIVCILCRKRDSRNLYKSIESDWQDLDNITGSRILVLLAGNEVDDSELSGLSERDLGKFCVTDNSESYILRYTPFATFIGDNNIKADLSSVRHDILEKHIPNVEKNQTDAIDSLRRYFGISERNIPCLVYTPLMHNKLPVQNIVVPFPKGEIDLYGYFKELFNEITPLLDELNIVDDEISHKIETTYQQLVRLANTSEKREEIMKCIRDRRYLNCEQPIRGLLNQYVDLCKSFEELTGTVYIDNRKSELISEIENAFGNTDFPLVEAIPVNAYIISIGDRNRIKNSTISITVQDKEIKFNR